MPLWNPDPTFYPSARLAMQAPAERHAFVAALNPKLKGSHDAICVVDLAAESPTYGKVVGRVEMPNEGDEVHHFGWNACSSALCPYAPHPHVAPARHRHQARSAAPQDREGDRARDRDVPRGLQPAPHGALCARRDLR